MNDWSTSGSIEQQRDAQPVDLTPPPQPVDFGTPPPYYLAAPDQPSQPAPQPQIVDRQAYWQAQKNIIDAQNTIQFNQNGPTTPFQRNDTETAFASPVGPDEGANTQPDWSYGGDPSQWYKDQINFGPNSGYLQNRWSPNGGQLLQNPPWDRSVTGGINDQPPPYPDLGIQTPGPTPADRNVTYNPTIPTIPMDLASAHHSYYAPGANGQLQSGIDEGQSPGWGVAGRTPALVDKIHLPPPIIEQARRLGIPVPDKYEDQVAWARRWGFPVPDQDIQPSFGYVAPPSPTATRPTPPVFSMGIPNAGLMPQPEQPTLLSLLNQLPVSASDKKQLMGAEPYIRERLQKGEPFPQIFKDVTGEAKDLGDVLTGAFTGLQAAVNKLPSAPLPTGLGGGVGGYQGKTVGESDPVTQFVNQSIPFILAGEILPAGVAERGFAAVGGAQGLQIADAYKSGQIDGKTALIQLAQVAPMIAPTIGKALGFGKALGESGMLASERGGGPPEGTQEPANLAKSEQAPDTTASAGIDSIVKKVRTAIVTARKLGPEQERMISEQKSIRVQGAAQRLEEGGGLTAFHESKSFLAGEYNKPTFEPLDLAPEDVNALVDHIGMSGADYFDRLGALTALEKATLGIKPADNELAKLDKILPKAGIRQAYETQAMAGTVRGAERFNFPEGPMADAGAVQPRLNESDAAYRARLQEHDAQAVASLRARHQAELDVLAASRARLRALSEGPQPPSGGTQSRLTDPATIERYRQEDAAAVENIRARHQAEMDRLARQQAADRAAWEYRRANPFPSDESALPQRGLPAERTGVTDQGPSLSNVGGMQTRLPATKLADAVNEAYVGAMSTAPQGAATTSKFTRILQHIVSPLQLMKTIKTSFDIGWGGRQGWRLLPRNPSEWWSMYGKQFRAFKSEANFNEIDSATKEFPNFTRSQQAERPLAYLEKGTGSPETSGEEFSSPLTKYIPGLNASERAYVAPGNWMRQAVLDKQIRRIVEATHAPVADADFQLLIDNLNNATLRGNTKWLGTANAQTLASLAFSLKGQVSGPQFAMDAIRAVVNGGDRYSPEARKIVAEQFGAYVGMGMATLGAAAATGWGLDKAGKPSFVNVDLNDLSPTFGQISVGGFRWNYWGADQSLIRNAIQIARGRQQSPGLPAQGADRLRLVNNLLRTKIAPGIPSLAYDELVNKGRNPYPGATGLQHINTPLGFLAYAFEQAVPIAGENAFQAYSDLGPAAVVPSFLAETHGLATSTYSNAPTADQLKKVAGTQLGDELKQAGLPSREDPYQDAGFRQALASSFGTTDIPQTYEEFKAARIAEAVKSGIPQSEAERRFNLNPIVTKLDQRLSAATLAFWKAHPDLLKRAIESGATSSSAEKVKILAGAR